MRKFLRPPGVLSEKDLQARCIGCGQCAQVCNYHCIEFTPDHFLGPGTPKVFHQESPCWLCMKCSEICPTNALRGVAMEQSGMGMAYLNLKKCVDYQEEAMVMCWTCYDRCPMRGKAIVLANGYVPAVTAACVGCGVCEYVCPIKAITVTPTRYLKDGQPDLSGQNGYPAEDAGMGQQAKKGGSGGTGTIGSGEKPAAAGNGSSTRGSGNNTGESAK